ncbi:MAG: hypothetical protein WKF97_21740 [Chitinophagaceae bacterium]
MPLAKRFIPDVDFATEEHLLCILITITMVFQAKELQAILEL